MDEVRERGFNLNISRYVDTFEPPELQDIAALQQEISGIESELRHLRSEMDRQLRSFGYAS